MKIIKITWQTGNMQIVCDNFFPASSTQINKLMKILYPRDWNYTINEDADALIQEIIDWMTEDIRVHEERTKQKANEFSNAETHRISYAEQAAVKKNPAGILLTKKELEHVRWERDYWKEESKKLKKDFTYSKKRVEGLKKNLEYINNLRK